MTRRTSKTPAASPAAALAARRPMTASAKRAEGRTRRMALEIAQAEKNDAARAQLAARKAADAKLAAARRAREAAEVAMAAAADRAARARTERDVTKTALAHEAARDVLRAAETAEENAAVVWASLRGAGGSVTDPDPSDHPHVAAMRRGLARGLNLGDASAAADAEEANRMARVAAEVRGAALAARLVAGELRAEVRPTAYGPRIAFLGGERGEHTVALIESSEERILAHWAGYVSSNLERAARPVPLR